MWKMILTYLSRFPMDRLNARKAGSIPSIAIEYQPAQPGSCDQEIRKISDELAKGRDHYSSKVWVQLQAGLAARYKYLFHSWASPRNEFMELAIEHYKLALESLSGNSSEKAWLNTTLGDLYTMRPLGGKTSNIETAIKYHLDALAYFNFKQFPEQWAMIQFNLGRAYYFRQGCDPSEDYKRAMKYCQLALKVFNHTAHPQQHNRVEQLILWINMADTASIKELQKTCFENFEADPENHPDSANISKHNPHLLSETFSTNIQNIDTLQIFTSRWIVLKTLSSRIIYPYGSHAEICPTWYIIDAKANQMVWQEEGEPKTKLEFIDILAHLNIPVNQDGVLLTDQPVRLKPYENATFWTYDSGGDSCGHNINLLSRQTKNFNGPHFFDENVFVAQMIDFTGNPFESLTNDLIISNLTIRCLPEGQVIFFEMNSGQQLASLKVGNTSSLAAVTPDSKTLVTVSKEGEIKLWQIKEQQ